MSTDVFCFSYQEILHSIHLTKKGNPGLKICDGHQELLKFLRSDIIEVASRLQKGGLGYLEDTSEFEEFEERVRDTHMWLGSARKRIRYCPVKMISSTLKINLTFHLCFKVQTLEKLPDFGECVIAVQESVIKKFLQGFMAPKQKKKKKSGGEESTTAEEVDDQKKLAEEARVSLCDAAMSK